MLVSTTTIDARKVCGSNAASLDANGVNYEAIVACARYNNASNGITLSQLAKKSRLL